MKNKEWIDIKPKFVDDIQYFDNKIIFSIIEFSLTNYCTRKCKFCPISVGIKHEEMDEDLYIKCIQQLSKINFSGLIALSGFCEPLTHSKIEKLIYVTKQFLPNCHLVINTNGELLDGKRIDKLLFFGVDNIIVSAYSKDIYDKFNSLKNKSIIINKRWKNITLTNRAGLLPSNKKLPMQRRCNYPFYMLYIDYNGDILFCPHNYNKENILGNIDNGILNVWFSEKLQHIKYTLSNDKREIIPCNKCDVNGLIMGDKYYEAWKKAEFTKIIKRPKISQWFEKENNFTILSNNQAPFGKYKNYTYSYPLYKKISNMYGCSTSNVLITNGAEEALRTIFNIFGESYVLRFDPIFQMLEYYEQVNKLKSIKVNYDSNLKIDSSEVLKNLEKFKNKLSIIYIAIPDNPTGQVIDINLLNNIFLFCEQNNIKLILDLTYYLYFKYTNNSHQYDNIINSFKTSTNLILVHSLSKSHGLAGVRSGFILSNEHIINLLSKNRLMIETNDVSIKETLKYIDNKRIIKKNIKHCEYWKSIFRNKFPNNYINTYTNFILLRFLDNKHIYYYNKLYERKILTRINFDHKCMDNIIRVGIGKSVDMKKVLKILE